jgi:hypothetical protein
VFTCYFFVNFKHRTYLHPDVMYFRKSLHFSFQSGHHFIIFPLRIFKNWALFLGFLSRSSISDVIFPSSLKVFDNYSLSVHIVIYFCLLNFNTYVYYFIFYVMSVSRQQYITRYTSSAYSFLFFCASAKFSSMEQGWPKLSL